MSALDNVDFTALDENLALQSEGIDVPIFKPGTQDVMFTIGVVGPDSDQQRRAAERGEEADIAQAAIGPRTRDEVRENNARYLSRCCCRWSLKDKYGKAVPFSEDNVYEVLLKYPHIMSAVNMAAGNRGRFTKRSQTASVGL